MKEGRRVTTKTRKGRREGGRNMRQKENNNNNDMYIFCDDTPHEE